MLLAVQGVGVLGSTTLLLAANKGYSVEEQRSRQLDKVKMLKNKIKELSLELEAEKEAEKRASVQSLKLVKELINPDSPNSNDDINH